MLLLDAITQIGNFIQVFVGVYVLVIFLFVMASWLRLPYSLNPVQRFLYEVCNPYLQLWRKILPLRFGPVDLTPLVAVFALIFAGNATVWVLNRFH